MAEGGACMPRRWLPASPCEPRLSGAQAAGWPRLIAQPPPARCLPGAAALRSRPATGETRDGRTLKRRPARIRPTSPQRVAGSCRVRLAPDAVEGQQRGSMDAATGSDERDTTSPPHAQHPSPTAQPPNRPTARRLGTGGGCMRPVAKPGDSCRSGGSPVRPCVLALPKPPNKENDQYDHEDR